MSARTQLNGTYFIGSLFLAALGGGLTQSWAVFWVALAGLVLANLLSGAIRPGRWR